ncbi:hypothetical protein [Collimonas pratensis]|uniref:Di-heme Cytochrome c peroxidase family protein n=1 Tax=Collimonas pratensis TaxID=279113 RepID=A0ABM5Z7J6_9BURK|nr:di-heme Cytochrome c peroxidase family protein [Collimonas pratensis]
MRRSASFRKNDAAAALKKNIDVVDAPFDRKQGEQPALNDDEIKDMVAFLKTLNDGYQAGAGQASAAR